jgi:hypothetical protein
LARVRAPVARSLAAFALRAEPLEPVKVPVKVKVPAQAQQVAQFVK